MITNTNADLQSLALLLKPDQLLTRPFELLTYEIDAAIDRGKPAGVVIVHSTNDIQKVMQWSVDKNVPVVARGAGTGLSGGAVAEHGGIIMEFSRLNRILEFDQKGRSVVVEPGVVNLKLDEYVKKVGLYYPPDPASGRAATIGGNIAENAGGPHCFKYGVTTNYLTGIELILPGGQLIHLGGRALDYPEYDLIGIVTGSEGTLGIIGNSYARLLRNPPAVKTMMAAFDTVDDAGQAVSAIIAQGLVPATMEFMDQKMMEIIEDYAHAGLPVKSGAALIIEVDGFQESLSVQMEEIVSILREKKAHDMRVAQTAEERDKIWFGRKSAAGAMARLSPSYYLLDGTVPRSKLARTLSEVTQVCDRLGLTVGYVFHAGDGNLHPFILIPDPTDKALMERVYQSGQEIMEICVGHGGSITGEHGVGIEKRRFMKLMFNREEIQGMLDIKTTFDPRGLMNPGKIFPEISTARPRQPAAGINKTGNEPMAPASEDEAAQAIRDYLSAGKRIRVRGGWTKSSLLSNDYTVLSSSNLAGISTYALEDLYVTVRAGTKLKELQSELAKDKMWVPIVSPWEGSTIGGIIASNFNAPLRMRYGNLRDLLLATTVVIPDGRIMRLGKPVVKNVAGYDMPKLMVGSFGTLGLMTDITLKLAPIPRTRASLITPVDNIAQGIEWGTQLMRVCLTCSSLLLCKGCSDISPAPYTLLYSTEGIPEDVSVELQQARDVLQGGGATGLLQINTPTGSDSWASWIRKGVPHPETGEVLNNLIRVGLAPRDLPGFMISQSNELLDSEYIADLANGLLYIQNYPRLQKIRDAAYLMSGYAVLLAAPSGSVESQPWGYQPESIDLMKGIKDRWDPSGGFNPGAFIV